MSSHCARAALASNPSVFFFSYFQFLCSLVSNTPSFSAVDFFLSRGDDGVGQNPCVPQLARMQDSTLFCACGYSDIYGTSVAIAIPCFSLRKICATYESNNQLEERVNERLVSLALLLSFLILLLLIHFFFFFWFSFRSWLQ